MHWCVSLNHLMRSNMDFWCCKYILLIILMCNFCIIAFALLPGTFSPPGYRPIMHVTQFALCPQRVSLHTFFQVCGQGFGHSVPYCQGESQAVEALDLPAPTCFRSRSHSYLRAIQAGCSQDEDTASVDSDSPPPTSTGYSFSSNTSEYQWGQGWGRAAED